MIVFPAGLKSSDPCAGRFLGVSKFSKLRVGVSWARIKYSGVTTYRNFRTL